MADNPFGFWLCEGHVEKMKFGFHFPWTHIFHAPDIELVACDLHYNQTGNAPPTQLRDSVKK